MTDNELDALVVDLRNVLIPKGYPISADRVREAADAIEVLRAKLECALNQQPARD